MSDLDKLFENAPEGAVAIRKTAQGKMFFENNKGEYYHGSWKSSFCDKWVIVATRPQPERKTVEDAVEYYNCVWPSNHNDAIAFNSSRDAFGAYKLGGDLNEKWHHVCDQSKFEACVAAKAESEPEWTHISTGGNKCRYLMETVHGDLYENEWGEKFIPGFKGCHSVEPIKKTITKAEHEFLCRFSADVNDIHVTSAVESYLAEHEVVE
jgi:hypothetical protein